MQVTRDMQRNKLMHLENTMVMYRIFNAETLENLVKPVHALHSRQTLYENLFASRTSAAYKSYLQVHGSCGIQHYCYVRKHSLVLKIVLDFFKCLGFCMHFISLYDALSLHNYSSSGSLVFAHLGSIN